MNVNLAPTARLTPGQARRLISQQLVYSCVLLVSLTIGVRLLRVWIRPYDVGGSSPGQESLSEIVRRRGELESLQQLRDWLMSAKLSRGRPIEMLNKVGDALPVDMWITEMIIKGDTVTLTGFSESESSVSTFLDVLAGREAITRARLDSSREVSGQTRRRREFKISGRMALRGGGEVSAREHLRSN